MYSAIKYKGQPLYKLAREGKTVERKPRKITIYKLELVEILNDKQAEFFVHCSKGTYVRTLVEDIGAVLGCGAHVVELRRLSVGHFQSEEMQSMSEIKSLYEQKDFEQMNAMLLPVESMLSAYPALILSPSMAYYVQQGQPIIIPKAPTSGYVALFEKDDGKLIGVGEVLDDGRIGPRRLL